MSSSKNRNQGVSLRISRLHRLELSDGDWTFTERPGGWWIATGPAGQRRRLQAIEVKNQLSFQVSGRAFAGEIAQASGSRNAGFSVDVDSELTSQFPGKVRKLLVAAGDLVEAGQPLLLIEAMKMEFSIKAPVAGKVTRILVQEAQQLSPGDRFVEFEVKK